jgi:serine/threonine-protein kinase
MKANLARACALAGRREEAQRLLDELTAGAPVSAYRVATVHAALGDADATFAWLERAADEHDHWLVWLRVDPMLEAVRADPRFAALVARVGFPESS